MDVGDNKLAVNERAYRNQLHNKVVELMNFCTTCGISAFMTFELGREDNGDVVAITSSNCDEVKPSKTLNVLGKVVMKDGVPYKPGVDS